MKDYLPLISSNNPQSFFVEKNAKKDQLNLQIVTAPSEKVKIDNKKIHKILICYIKKNKKMNVEDFLMIRG